MKNRNKRIVLLAVLALLLVAAVVTGVTLYDRAQPDPTPAAAETASPVPDKGTPPPAETPEASEMPEESERPDATDTPAPSATPDPTTTPTPTPTPEAQVVTITIVCYNALQSDALPDGVRAILPAGGVLVQRTVPLEEGDTVWSVTRRVCQEAGVSLEANYAAAQSAVYVEGIGQLYEFDCGEGSGWIYKVNGTAPGVGCDSCALRVGDSITWAYTCNYGNDV